MKLPPILSVIWARRAVFLVPVVGALIGSSVAMAITPPQYQASARVMLNYVKPERDTGLFVNSKMADSYEKTQIDFVREPEVAALAAEAMGWLDSPEMQEAYALRDPRDTRDMRTWIGARLAGNIGAAMVEDSNILEIRYFAPTPEVASAVVSAIRDAYIQASTNQFRQSADQQATATAARLEETRDRIAKLESQKTLLERATGIIMDPGIRDLDAMRLSGLVGARLARPVLEAPLTRKQMMTAAQADYLDQTLKAGAEGLGPNNPRYQAMTRQRDQMKAVADNFSGRDNPVGDFITEQRRAQEAMLESVKAKILSQRDETLQLRLLQDQIDQARVIALGLSQNVVEQRQLSVAERTGLVPMGQPTEGEKSIRSNAPVIISTAVGMGVLYGALLALLVEFLARKIRTVQGLQIAARAPVIGVIPRRPRDARQRSEQRRPKRRAWFDRAKPARA